MKPEPDSVKHKLYGHLVFAAVAVVGSGSAVLRGTFGGQSIDDAGMVAAGIAGFAALAHLLLAFCEPRILSLPQALALLLVVLAPLAFLYPSYARPDEGWPLNPGRGPRAVGTVHSRVVSPGDEVSVAWSAEGIESVGALWRGTPKVEVVNAAELGCAQALPGTGREATWEQWIWTKGSLQKCPPFLSAQFSIPKGPQLAGQSIKLRMTLPITYPAPLGDNEYEDKRKTIVREDVILLAPPAVKQAYWNSWKMGASLGLAGTSIGGLLLVGLAFGLRSSSTAISGAVSPLQVSVKPC